MKYAPAFAGIATRLRARGFTVIEQPGWQDRGHGDLSTIEAVVNHHTVDNPPGDYPSLRVVRDGRAGLKGPLSQWGVGRLGTIHLIAAGRAFHAGTVREGWMGNYHSIGIEIANNGVGEPYGAATIHAAVALNEELQHQFDLPTSRLLAHKEVCSPRGRKIDPSFDMSWFRAQVGKGLGPSGSTAPTAPVVVPPLAPAAVEESRRAPDHLPTLSARSPRGEGWVFLLQRALVELGYLRRGADDGHFGSGTRAAVQRLQRDTGLTQDGVVGMQTWCKGLLARKGTLRRGQDTGSQLVEVLQNLLGFRGGELDRDFGPATEGRFKQVQRWGGLSGSGVDGVVGPIGRDILSRG